MAELDDLMATFEKAKEAVEAYASYGRVASDFMKMQDAWMTGAEAADFQFSKPSDNPFSTPIYRWAWFSGFDIGRRIKAMQEAHEITLSIGLRMQKQLQEIGDWSCVFAGDPERERPIAMFADPAFAHRLRRAINETKYPIVKWYTWRERYKGD